VRTCSMVCLLSGVFESCSLLRVFSLNPPAGASLLPWLTKLPRPSVTDSSSLKVGECCSSLLAAMWSCEQQCVNV
jgi:hypothetical protein